MTISPDQSFALCKSVARRSGSNFYLSFLALPPERFRDMCALYAFMRHSDDLGDDERIPPAQRAERLQLWRETVCEALAGGPVEHPLLPAVRTVVERHRIPHRYLLEVIDGVRMDLDHAGFESFDELAHYCYHVAGAVGLCCIHVWGFRDSRALSRAVDCGCAFQLTNILRDLGEDADRRRIYLPREDLDRFGYSPDDLLNHCRDDRFHRLMHFQATRARSYYARALELFDLLEPAGARIFAAMLETYAALLHKMERCDFDVFSRRLRLSRWRRLWILARSLAGRRAATVQRLATSFSCSSCPTPASR